MKDRIRSACLNIPTIIRRRDSVLGIPNACFTTGYPEAFSLKISGTF